MVVVACQDPEMISYAKSKGAKGLNLAGMCCTAIEILVRHGIPVAGNFLQQELAIVTGAVDAMVIDVQCDMQALHRVSQCFHTQLITTSPKAKIEGATHMNFNEHDAINTAKADCPRRHRCLSQRDKNKAGHPRAAAGHGGRLLA